MKGDLEDAVKKLGIPHTIILRPGLLVGERGETRLAEATLRKLAQGMGAVHSSLKDFWAQDADVVAKAGLQAASKCAKGEHPEGVWVVAQADITRLGRTEWSEGSL